MNWSSQYDDNNMPKRKRRNNDINRVGQSTEEEDAIESCLAEMAGTSSIASTTAPTDLSHAQAVGDDVNTELWDPSLAKIPFPLSRQTRDRIHCWNRAVHSWQKTGTYTPGLLPSFDVELTRHFKVQALSTFLLDASNVKMPAFERW